MESGLNTKRDLLPHKILCVVGARPNFMKMAPILAALKQRPGIQVALVHTGQHYDAAMNHQYFEALNIPVPDFNLGVGSGSHAQQTAEIMRKFEPVVTAWHPDAALVVGDVNSTLACALVASKLNIPVIHVEAGLRSCDRTMPEEINRVLTDQLSSLLFTTERAAEDNLVREGIDPARIHFVGNVMIDTLRHNLDKAIPVSSITREYGVASQCFERHGYAVLTLHRPSNVDDADVFRGLLTVVSKISDKIPIIFTVHPRTLSMIQKAGLQDMIQTPRILTLPPMGYLHMLGLMMDARLVLTDSGGIQEETTALGVPCVTLRESTERPITVEQGTNTLAGIEPSRIMSIVEGILSGGGKAGRIPQYWDGSASVRIAETIESWLHRDPAQAP